jgi:5-methylphenazine-1-carboxylate 1-monooxygenase
VKAIIAGAGIGGLVSALTLSRAGVDVQVYEAVREVQPLGVGINLLPHAMGVLAGLGLLDEIRPLGVETAELCYFNRHGQLIWREPRGLAAGYDVPQVSLHRGRLQLTLLEIVRRTLGADAVRTGLRVHDFEQRRGDRNETPTAVEVELHDRTTGTIINDRADILIGADGIHSAVRASFHPDEGAPSWSGTVLWRSTSTAPPFLTGRSMFMAGHRPHKFVAYPISGVDESGLCEVNWIAELDRRDVGLADREDWNRLGDRADFAARFDDWTFDWLDIPALIASASAIYEYPMVDRDPLARWTHGRVTLLGDAAHPMYPIGSNGASQAILDAQALAGALTSHESIDDALIAYDDERRPRTAAIVRANREHGPEQVMDLAEERAPDGFTQIGDVFGDGELESISASYKQIAGFQRPATR